MKQIFESVMLIDDNEHDNYFHERAIEELGCTKTVVTITSGQEALDFLQNCKKNNLTPPELIFLDINMPGMNGWEFLEEYTKLHHLQKGEVVVIMLTTSVHPEDEKKALEFNEISYFLNKPLTAEYLTKIIKEFFSERL